jgi:PHD-like zinc-binding domain/Zinc finger, C3HC4 type (RING finger)
MSPAPQRDRPPSRRAQRAAAADADFLAKLSALPSDAEITSALASLHAAASALVDQTQCPICADGMRAASQLTCGHYCCGSCVSKILDNRKMRCPFCKHPTNKRSLRFTPILAEDICNAAVFVKSKVDDAVSVGGSGADESARPAMNDGFAATSMHQLRLHQQRQQRQVELHERSLKSFERSLELSSSPSASPPFLAAATATAPPSRASFCAFCPAGVDPSSVLPPSTTVNLSHTVPLPLASAKARPRSVHEECALFARDVQLRGTEFLYIPKSIKASRKTLCARDACGRTGASVCCAASACTVAFHLVCALATDGCKVMEDGSYKLYCPGHRNQAPVPLDMEMEIAPDCTQGRESMDVCMACGIGGHLVLCDGDGCDRATHMACANLKVVNVCDDWFCSYCLGVTVAASDAAGVHKENKLPALSKAPGVSSTKLFSNAAKTKSSPKRTKRSLASSQPVSRKRKSTVLQPVSFNTQPALATAMSSPAKTIRPCTKSCDNATSEGLNDNFASYLATANIPGDSQRNQSQHLVYKRVRRTQTGGPAMVIIATGLDAVSQALLARFKTRYKATVSIVKDYSPRVTHVVVTAYNSEDTPTRTVKLCKGIVANLPIVCLKWIDVAMAAPAGYPCPPPEQYLHKYTLNVRHMSPFAGLRFYFGSLQGYAIRKEDLIEIVKTGKGSVMLSEPTVHTSTTKGPIYIVRAKPNDADGANSNASVSIEPSQLSRQRRKSASWADHVPNGCTLITADWILDQATGASAAFLNDESFGF